MGPPLFRRKPFPVKHFEHGNIFRVEGVSLDKLKMRGFACAMLSRFLRAHEITSFAANSIGIWHRWQFCANHATQSEVRWHAAFFLALGDEGIEFFLNGRVQRRL